MDDRSGRIGRYRLIRKLGEGGMGIVYLAHDADSAPVALKVLRPELAGQPDFQRRFAREAEAARKVARFCTAPILDAGIEEDVAYIVTEYVDGPDLSSVVEAQGPMAGASLEALAVGVATALTAIHEAGVVHLDLKPSNILLSAVGPRVIDFGIARLTVADATQSAVVSGTPAYMAPEQANGLPLTPACDVFAWGGVVAYAGTGSPPFGTGAVPEVLYRVVHHVPKLDGLDERLWPLVEQALHKDPSRRPTAQQLLDRLMGRERVKVASATQAVSDSWTPVLPDAPEPAPRPRRNVAAPLTASALAVLITAGVLLALWRPWTGTGAAARPEPRTVVSTVVATVTQDVTATADAPSSSAPPKTTVATGTVKPGTQKAAATFRHSNGWSSNIPGHVQITALTRKGDTLRVEATVTNDGDRQEIWLDTLLSGSVTTSVENIQVFVPGEAFPLKPLQMDGKCACTSWKGGSVLGAGESMHLYASFRGVPKDVEAVDIDLPKLGTFRNVLIGER